MEKFLAIVTIVLWVGGLLAPDEYKALFWALPAGFATGYALAKLLSQLQ